MEYALASREPGGITDPAYLDNLAAFAEWYGEQPETIHVNVITDTFRHLNMSMHGDDPAEYRLPASRELAAQYLLLYELSVPIGLDLNNQIDPDRSATRMIVATQTLSSNEVIDLDRRAMLWLSDHAPHIARPASAGTTLMFANLGRRNIVGMLLGTTLALVGISFILIFALRSLRLGFTSLVPNLVPGALGFGIWGLTVGQVGLSSRCVGITWARSTTRVHFLESAGRRASVMCADAVRVAIPHRATPCSRPPSVWRLLVIVCQLSSSSSWASHCVVIALALIADFSSCRRCSCGSTQGGGASRPPQAP